MSGLRWAKVSRLKAQNHVLVDAPVSLLGDQVLDEAGAGHDGRPEPAGGTRVHVRATAPVVAGGRQPQAGLVLEHMGRRVDLDVHGPPEGDPHGRAVGRPGLLVRHDVLSLRSLLPVPGRSPEVPDGPVVEPSRRGLPCPLVLPWERTHATSTSRTMRRRPRVQGYEVSRRRYARATPTRCGSGQRGCDRAAGAVCGRGRPGRAGRGRVGGGRRGGPERLLPGGATPLWSAVDGGSSAIVSAVRGDEPRLRLAETSRERLPVLAGSWYGTGAVEELRRGTRARQRLHGAGCVGRPRSETVPAQFRLVRIRMPGCGPRRRWRSPVATRPPSRTP